MYKAKHMNCDFSRKENIINALRFHGRKQEELFNHACKVRDEVFNKKVEIRSVVEYSNICRQACCYCGMNKKSDVERFILKRDDVLKQVADLYGKGRRVIMFQTGEYSSDNYFNSIYLLLKEIKRKYQELSITCCFGNMPGYQYKKLRDIGIDRYLLKFETSDSELYKKIKPTDTLRNRLDHLEIIKKLGFHVGSGNMTGLPGQTLDSLAEDIMLLKKLDVQMGSTSVFIPNDMSKFADRPSGDLNLALNFMAVLRIVYPAILIPSTSSLNLLNKDGLLSGLMAGANTITMHDGTPLNEEEKFVIYKSNRYRPRNTLIKAVEKTGLKPVNVSLIRKR